MEKHLTEQESKAAEFDRQRIEDNKELGLDVIDSEDWTAIDWPNVAEEIPFNEDKYKEYLNNVNVAGLKLLAKLYPEYKIEVVPLQAVDAGHGDFDVNIKVNMNGEDAVRSNVTLGLADPIALAKAINFIVHERVDLLNDLVAKGIDVKNLDCFDALGELDFTNNIYDFNNYFKGLLREAE